MKPLVEEQDLDLAVQSGSENRDFEIVGKLDKPVFCNTKSRIVNSPLLPIFGPSFRKPAYLTVTPSGVDPMELAREQYKGEIVQLDQKRLNLCSVMLMKHFFSNAVWLPESREPISFVDAVRGFPGDKHWKGISRKTSPGYPWMLETKGPGKTDFFGSEGDYSFDSPLCRKLMNKVVKDLDKAAQTGLESGHIYRDFLKDELRPIEKVEAGKSRMVSGAPLDHLIEMRMYFGQFARFLTKNNVSIGIAVGANPYSADWDLLVKYFKGNTTHLIAGDYKHYDGSLTPQLLYSFMYMADLFYGVEDYKIRQSIMSDIVCSKHVYRDMVYQFYKGMPSGNPMTSLINSVCNQLLIYYNVSSILSDKGLSLQDSVVTAFSELRAVTLGDDNVISMSPYLRDSVTYESFVDRFKEMGYVYTDEVKDQSMAYNYRSIDQISFLKRSFVFDPVVGRYIAPLSMDTILDMPRWTKLGDESNYWSILIAKLQTSLYELSLHGRTVFQAHREKYLQASKVLNCVLNTDFDLCKDKALSLDYDWN